MTSSESALRLMWQRLQQAEGHQEDPALLETFGRLLGDIAARERRARTEQQTLETALRQQQETMQSQVQRRRDTMRGSGAKQEIM